MEASISNSELNGSATYVLVFIKETNSTPAFQAAYKKSMELELDPQIISIENFNTLEVEIQDKIYVVSSFESDLFASLDKLGCAIMGPVALLMAMQDGCRGIIRRKRPTLNLIMRPCIITFSSLSMEMKTELTIKILHMGGQVYPSLTATTTHLITETVGTYKYHVAVKNKIPIMLPSWIDAMMEDHSINPKLANDPIYERHKMPLFYRLTIAVSNIESVKRKEMANFIKENGGHYSAVLKKDFVSHLIIPEPSGEKFKAACNWGIKCVKPEWYEECVKQGNVVSEEPFLLESSGKPPKHTTSTPTKKNQISETMCASAIKISFIDPNASVNTTVMSAQDGEHSMIDRINVLIKEENCTSKREDELKVQAAEETRIPQEDNHQNDDVTFVPNEDVAPQNPGLVTTNDETLQPQLDENKENELATSSLFKGLMFDVEDYHCDSDGIKELIIINGGVISKNPDYIIVPMIMLKKERKLQRNHEYVTVCWLQLCLEAEEILPLDENFIFRPLTIPDKVETDQPLKNCVITLSQFNCSIEQEALRDLITFLGGMIQDSLIRSTHKKKGLIANTHLILKRCEGKKFEAAQTWGIKTLKAEWLYACATTGELVNEEGFFVKQNDPAEDVAKPWAAKEFEERVNVQAAIASTSLETNPISIKPVIIDSVKAVVPTTSSETKPINDKPKKIMIEKSGPGWKPRPVKFDLSSYGIDVENLDDSFDTKIQKNLTSVGKFANTFPPDHFKSTEFQCVYLTTSIRFRNSKQQPALFKIAEDLRINCFKEDNDKRITHVVHEQSLSEPLPSDVKYHLNARKRMVVSPEWIYECHRQQKYLEPSLFPYHYKKRLSLAAHISSQKLESPVKDDTLQNMTINNDVSQSDNNLSLSNRARKNLDESLKVTNISLPKAAAAVKAAPGTSTQDFEKHLDMFMSATKALKNVAEEKKNLTQIPVVEPRHRSFPRTETQPLDIDDLCLSQQAPIIWSDQPRDASGHNFSGMTTTCHEEPFMHTQKVFHLSTSQSDEELQELIEIIELFGAKALFEKQFNNAATHSVVEKMSKSERMLSFIAAGKIIIHKDYLKDSKKAGKFLDEDKYVIGSQAYIRVNNVEGNVANTMAAIYRWQQKFKQTGEGAFSDWCVYLNLNEKKSQVYRRVLEAGGATIVESHEAMVESKKRMAFFDKSNPNIVDVCQQLMSKQIWCLRPEYFADYLHIYPEPDIEAYLFPGTEKFLSLIRSRPIKKQKIDN